MSHSVIIIDKTNRTFYRYSPPHSGAELSAIENNATVMVFDSAENLETFETQITDSLDEGSTMPSAIASTVQEVFG